jgi:hypothetical protein
MATENLSDIHSEGHPGENLIPIDELELLTKILNTLSNGTESHLKARVDRQH